VSGFIDHKMWNVQFFRTIDTGIKEVV